MKHRVSSSSPEIVSFSFQCSPSTHFVRFCHCLVLWAMMHTWRSWSAWLYICFPSSHKIWILSISTLPSPPSLAHDSSNTCAPKKNPVLWWAPLKKAQHLHLHWMISVPRYLSHSCDFSSPSWNTQEVHTIGLRYFLANFYSKDFLEALLGYVFCQQHV